MKRKKNCAIMLFVVFLMIFMSGCGVKKLSGKYVNENNKSEYFKFSGESKVTYHNEQGSKVGNYRIENNALIAYFEEGEELIFLEVKDKKTLYEGYTTAYVKKNFLQRHWEAIVIFLVIYSIVSLVYTKITGRNLEDDLENLLD